MSRFDEEPDGDPHGECAAEIAAIAADRDYWREQALAAPAQPAPDGWVMVPREPTVEMRRAAAKWLTHYHLMRAVDKTNAITDAWQAMIAAAPAQPTVLADHEIPFGPKCCNKTVVTRCQGCPHEQPAVREPLTDEQIALAIFEARVSHSPFKRDGSTSFRRIARAIEQAHGITGGGNG